MRQLGWLGGQRSAVSCPVEIKRKQRRVKDPGASGMSGHRRQQAGVSSPPSSCPSLSCLQCLPLRMACTVSSRSCPTSRAGAHAQDPQSLTRTPTPSKLLPEKGGASKIKPGLEPDPRMPSCQRSPAPRRQGSEPSPARHSTAPGCPLERAGWGAEAAWRCPGASLAVRVLFGERTPCWLDPHGTARQCCRPRGGGPHSTVQGLTRTPDGMAWGFSLCAQPAHLVRGSNCSLSLHTQSARLAGLHAPSRSYSLAQPACLASTLSTGGLTARSACRLGLHAQLGLHALFCSPGLCARPGGLAACLACMLSLHAGPARLARRPACSLSLHTQSVCSAGLPTRPGRLPARSVCTLAQPACLASMQGLRTTRVLACPAACGQRAAGAI